MAEAYETWGLKSALKVLMEYAELAILDLEKRQVHLCRHSGIKPLYYRNSTGSFSFASEIKAFTALPDWSAQANEVVIHDFLFKSLLDHSEDTFLWGKPYITRTLFDY